MPFGFLRVIVGVLCVVFAHFLGRAAIRMLRGQARQSTAISYTLRTAVAGGAVIWHAGFDRITTVTYVLSAAALAGGVYLEWRPKRHEELEKVMFPPE